MQSLASCIQMNMSWQAHLKSKSEFSQLSGKVFAMLLHGWDWHRSAIFNEIQIL